MPTGVSRPTGNLHLKDAYNNVYENVPRCVYRIHAFEFTAWAYKLAWAIRQERILLFTYLQTVSKHGLKLLHLADLGLLIICTWWSYLCIYLFVCIFRNFCLFEL